LSLKTRRGPGVLHFFKVASVGICFTAAAHAKNNAVESFKESDAPTGSILFPGAYAQENFL
jgi:hypothetical protein